MLSPFRRLLASSDFGADPFKYLMLALYNSNRELCSPTYKWQRRFRLRMKECCRQAYWFEYSEAFYRAERRKELRAKYGF